MNTSSVDFKPTIEWSTKHDGYWLTAPRNIRAKTWEILDRIQSNVLDMDGGKPTEIFVKTNPGYNPNQALFALVTSVHIALTGDIGDVLQVGSYAKHIEAIKDEITLQVTSSLSDKDIKYWLDTWIMLKTVSELKNIMHTMCTFNLGWIEERLNFVITRRNKIQRDLSWLKQPILKYQWLAQCDSAIEKIGAIHMETIVTNGQIGALVLEANGKFENFVSAVESIDDKSAIYHRYRAIVDALEAIAFDVGQLYESVDTSSVVKLRRNIDLLGV